MMDSTTNESCVPPGFRFHPTDEELVGYYLRKKVASQKIDLDVIRDIDLYRIEPWDLQDKCRIGYEEQNEWYFFSHKDKKYPTGTRTNRATMAGFWKATGRDKAVYDRAKLIGMRKTLVFYKGRAPNGQKTDWIMHEYRLESEENGPPQEEGWVVCRAFKKRMTGQTTMTKNTIEAGMWDPSYYYDEPSNNAHVASSNTDYSTRRQQHINNNNSNSNNNFVSAHNLICKQEAEAIDHHLHFVQCADQFVQQLPQLESPSQIININNKNKNEDLYHHISSQKSHVTTDWRDLDRFVASQLSHGAVSDAYDERIDIGSGFDSCIDPNDDDSGLGLLLLQTGRDQAEEAAAGTKLINQISSSTTSDCDIGICIFNK